ncbi:hypothetical protein IFM89_016442 [Coptis chinensis]|uniref:AAA+ ATPase domain-containing protein n=1 Tax=Coptis chinensis TaxID=261450 RepID=A0A835GWI4_9MAGN|nr:hypothetical protein IFM89_016442 [Coptis chinensis]
MRGATACTKRISVLHRLTIHHQFKLKTLISRGEKTMSRPIPPPPLSPLPHHHHAEHLLAPVVLSQLAIVAHVAVAQDEEKKDSLAKKDETNMKQWPFDIVGLGIQPMLVMISKGVEHQPANKELLPQVYQLSDQIRRNSEKGCQFLGISTSNLFTGRKDFDPCGGTFVFYCRNMIDGIVNVRATDANAHISSFANYGQEVMGDRIANGNRQYQWQDCSLHWIYYSVNGCREFCKLSTEYVDPFFSNFEAESGEGARVMWGYINRILGQPSLIRESSIGKYPLLGPLSRAYNKGLKIISGSGKTESKPSLENIVLHPSLRRRIEQLAGATANTKAHQAPFLNMLYYGPPGTGKTMVAKEIARKSGLDYAMMTGGDVAPLGAEAVTKIHQIFDWAKKSKEGLLLFIDEADAFLCELQYRIFNSAPCYGLAFDLARHSTLTLIDPQATFHVLPYSTKITVLTTAYAESLAHTRNSIHMSEAQRSALNALLFRTGDQSRDVALVLATNRPGDLDSAVTDRIDEVIEFPLPGAEERAKLLTLYLEKYLSEKDDPKSWWRPFKGKKSKKIVKDLPREVICVASEDGRVLWSRDSKACGKCPSIRLRNP